MRLPQFAICRWRPLAGPLLNSKVVWGCFIGCLAIGGIVLGLLARNIGRAAESQADAKAVNLAAMVEQDIRRNIELLGLSAQSAIGGLELLGRQDPIALARNRALIERLPRDQYVDFIQILDENGNIAAGSPPPAQNRNWADRDYFRALRPANAVALYIGRPFATAYGDNAAIPLGHRITGQDGSFAGVMVMGVRLAYFRELFARLGLSPDDAAALLRDDGTVLMRFPDRSEPARRHFGGIGAVLCIHAERPYTDYRDR